jgi:hypothetical protein
LWDLAPTPSPFARRSNACPHHLNHSLPHLTWVPPIKIRAPPLCVRQNRAPTAPFCQVGPNPLLLRAPLERVLPPPQPQLPPPHLGPPHQNTSPPAMRSPKPSPNGSVLSCWPQPPPPSHATRTRAPTTSTTAPPTPPGSAPVTCPAVPNSAPAPTLHRDDTPVSKNRTSHVTETRRARATPHNEYTGPPRYVPPALCNNIKTSYRSQHTQSTRSQVVYNMYI